MRVRTPPVTPRERPVEVAAAARFVGDATFDDSDHRPILFSTHGVDVLSWNVAWRYAARDGGGVNNGFGRTGETAAAYRARMERTAARVEQMVRAERPGVLVLQENARDDDTLVRALRAKLAPLGYSIATSGELVTATKGARPLTVPKELARQGGSLQASLLDEPRVVVVNMHLRWDAAGGADEKATAKDLRAVVRHLQRVAPGAPLLLAGDANRAARASKRDGAVIEDAVDGEVLAPPGSTNLRWDAATKSSAPTFADCAVWIAPSSS